jgi:subtilisin family serine protease
MAMTGARLKRTPDQMEKDQATVRRQLAELDPARTERLNQIIDGIRRRQDEAPQAYAVKFDRYRQKGDDPASVGKLVARGQLVVAVSTPGLAPVEKILSDLGYAPQATRTCDGLVRDNSTRVYVSRGRRLVEQLMVDCETLREQGIRAALNPIVPLGHVIKGEDFPAPTTVSGGTPSTGGPGGAPVRIAIIDTGITPEIRTDHWLGSIVRTAQNVDFLDVLPFPGDNRLDWFSGHGTFVSGIMQQIAPGAEVRVYRFTTSDGLGTEKDVAEAILRAAQDAANDGVRLVVNLSMGVPAVGGVPPVALESAVAQLANDPNVLLVGAAGNDGNDEPMYPAAFDDVIGVGALKADYDPAPFSNFGKDFLDCSAVGVGIVSTFVAGLMPPEPTATVPDYTFPANSWAVWSGTSFSTPQICAAVAALCRANANLSPRAAFTQLTQGEQELQGYGFIIHGLLPGTPA